MAFCSNCGNELKDGAQFCPNCGQQVNQRPSKSEQPKGFVDSFKETWKELESEEKNKSNLQSKPKNEDNNKLSKGQKITLGIAAFCALSGIFGGMSDGMWLAVIVSLGAMAAICAVFMGKIDRKYAWITAIGSLFVVIMAIGASASDENKKQNNVESTSVEQKQDAEEKQATSEEKEQIETKESDTEVKEEQVPQKSKEEEIRELGYRDGVIWGKEDKGQYLVEYIQMGLPMSSALERVKQVARMGYKENYGSDISDELLEEFAEQFMEGYKSVVVKE